MQTDSFSLLARAAGWAVLHSIWQIGMVWLAFQLLARLLHRRHQLIYLASLAAMAISAGWFCLTFSTEYQAQAQRFSMTTGAASSAAYEWSEIPATTAAPESAAVDRNFWQMCLDWAGVHALEIGWLWAAVVALLWVRLLGGWWLAGQLRRRNVRKPSSDFETQCRALAHTLGIRLRVTLLESPHIREPLTMGFWKPVILFPAGMLLSLSPAQVEALLLHELAHIRRYDYLVNLFQIALETCFFYHPLFRNLSQDARERREFCCDDIVIRHNGNRLVYAQTLTGLQLATLNPTLPFAMHATGSSRFTRRIRRIAGLQPDRESRPGWVVLLLFPALLLTGVSMAFNAPDKTQAPSLVSSFTEQQDTLPPAQKPLVETGKPGNAQHAEASELIPPADIAQTEPEPETVAIQASKMNVFYAGVDNPLRVAVAGVAARNLEVQLIGEGTITGSNGQYTVRVSKTGEVTLRVVQKSGDQIVAITDQKYRVKRIPDPSASLGGFRGSVISKEDLLSKKSLLALFENFDFEAVCNLISYEITILPRGQDPITYNANGGAIPEAALEFIKNMGNKGGAVFFDNIQASCSGDTEPRQLRSLAFKIPPSE